MAINSNWITLTNNILRQSALSEISPVNFDQQGVGVLTRYQSCAKEYIRHIHEMWSVDLPTEFARRKMQLNITEGQSIYPLDIGISVESLTFDSFRNITQNGSASKLYNWTYEFFSRRYPDVSQIETSRPTHYILLPVDRVNSSPVYNVRIFPNPDSTYNLEYIAQVNAYQLALSTDQVLWPPEYNHVLEELSRADLEDILGEGKGATVGSTAYRAYQKMRAKATRPSAERKTIRMQVMYTRKRSLGYYPSPNDADAPYSTPDTIR